jgi:hypothetical protein
MIVRPNEEVFAIFIAACQNDRLPEIFAKNFPVSLIFDFPQGSGWSLQRESSTQGRKRIPAKVPKYIAVAITLASFSLLPRLYMAHSIQGFSSCLAAAFSMQASSPAQLLLANAALSLQGSSAALQEAWKTRAANATRWSGKPGIPNLREFATGQPVSFVKSRKLCDLWRGNMVLGSFFVGVFSFFSISLADLLHSLAFTA